MTYDPYTCTMCGKPVDPNAKDTYRRVLGWKSGESSTVYQIEPAPGWACKVCVRWPAKNPNQPKLL